VKVERHGDMPPPCLPYSYQGLFGFPFHLSRQFLVLLVCTVNFLDATGQGAQFALVLGPLCFKFGPFRLDWMWKVMEACEHAAQVFLRQRRLLGVTGALRRLRIIRSRSRTTTASIFDRLFSTLACHASWAFSTAARF
jgi:hypothetical protein